MLAETLLAMAVVGGLVGFLAWKRAFLTFGTETDFVGPFLGNAESVLLGKPLGMDFHPPLYAITLAVFKLVIGDWITTGLFLSWVSCLVVVATQFLLFYEFVDRTAAWGSALALGSSPLFLCYAALATSDVFFLALYSLALYGGLKAVCGGARWSMGTGLAVGLALLTRSNAPVLMPLCGAPLLGAGTVKARVRRCRPIVAGLLLPIAAWGVMAQITESSFVPTRNHVNLAMTYFSQGNRIGAESRIPMEEQFDGLLDVLSHDPVHMAKQYLRDLESLMGRVFDSYELVAFPLHLLALPGLILLGFAATDKHKTLLLVVTLLHVLLVNFKTYEARYFLFLIPLIGAGAVIALVQVTRAVRHRGIRFPVLLGLAALFAAGFAHSYSTAWNRLHAQDHELGTAIPAAQRLIEPGAAIVARKRHLGFYVGRNIVYFPQTNSFEELGTKLKGQATGRPLYLYYGTTERSHRPALAALASPEHAPPWLEMVAHSSAPRLWVLYRVKIGEFGLVPLSEESDECD